MIAGESTHSKRSALRDFLGGVSNHSKRSTSRQLRRQGSKRSVASKTRGPKSVLAPVGLNPQDYLDKILKKRGYSTKQYTTLGTAYHQAPTDFQLASFDGQVLKMILCRLKDTDTFRNTLASGISPNACNKFGESFIHKVCRRGDDEFLEIFLECGAEIRIADDYGRTPMHDACWSVKPAFKVIETLMQQDIRLFYLTDANGALPLSYVRKESHSVYIEFLDSVKEVYWPKRNIKKDGEEKPPPLFLQKRGSLPIPIPKNALSMDLAKMVASGRILPEVAQLLQEEEEGNTVGGDTCESTATGSNDFDSDSEYSEGESEWGDNSHAEILEFTQAVSSREFAYGCAPVPTTMIASPKKDPTQFAYKHAEDVKEEDTPRARPSGGIPSSIMDDHALQLMTVPFLGEALFDQSPIDRAVVVVSTFDEMFFL